MTDVINFFQSIFIRKNSEPENINSKEVNLAVSLRREARSLKEKADEEMNNGRTTRALALEAKDVEKIIIFTKIAVWHNRRAAEKYRQAAERFEGAGKIQTGKSKAFEVMTKEMMRRAAEAEGNVEILENL